jgi:hypothetical protein
MIKRIGDLLLRYPMFEGRWFVNNWHHTAVLS